jgi:hypothetical protein
MTGWSGFVHRYIVHRSEPLAVSHRPKVVPVRVCECYGLTQDESAFVEGRNDRRG